MPEPPAQPADSRLIIRDLGRIPYEEAYEIQKELQQEVIGWREAPGSSSKVDPDRVGYLLLLEHDPPVITISRRKEARKHLIATPAQLDAAGVHIAETDRGGDITYHGPGQLIAYPILDLNTLALRTRSYMRFLEQIVIDTLATFGLEGHRDPQATGVWIKKGSGYFSASSATQTSGGGGSKICAMGVRITRWVSMHGLALNIAPNLDHFNLIIPCGLTGRTVTSMQQLLGSQCPTMQTVKDTLSEEFTQAARP